MEIDSRVSDDAILGILGEIVGLPDVGELPNLDLFEEGLLDSLSLVKLLVALSENYGINLTPVDIRWEEWATPCLVLRSVRSYLPA